METGKKLPKSWLRLKQNYRRLRNSLFLEQSVAVCHQKTVGRLHWRNQQFLMFLSLTNRCLSYDGTMNTRLSCWIRVDRKSTRLNSSHVSMSYAVFCLKEKNDLLTRQPLDP